MLIVVRIVNTQHSEDLWDGSKCTYLAHLIQIKHVAEYFAGNDYVNVS